MTWIKQQEKNHLCDLPDMFIRGQYISHEACSLGDVWQCDECDRYWRVVTEKGQFFFQNFTSSDYPTLPQM